MQGGAMLLPWSMLPDIVDEDELRCGERREGDFYGFVMQINQTFLNDLIVGNLP